MKDAINGFVVMSSMLEAMFNNMALKKVPLNWEEAAYPSLKPLAAWFEELVQRLEFMQRWLDEGYLSSYWVSAYYFPQGFMTAVLQTYARKTKIPIDKLVFKTTVMKENGEDLKDQPHEGVHIHGHFLEGCGWDSAKGMLKESEKGKLFEYMPAIWIMPILITEYSDVGCYNCPVYKTSLRKGELSTTGHSTNFVMFLDIHAKEAQVHWINRGVALLLTLDD